MNSILVPLDTSEAATAVLEPAAKLAKALGYKIVLLTVSDVVVTNSLSELMDSEHITAEQALQTYLAQHAQELRDADIEVETMVIDGHDSAGCITDTAEARGAEMIVMATHGRTGPARWLLGSTAERVMRSSSVPIHLIPVR